MERIYDFEQNTPPILNERILLAELSRRKLRRQTALIVVAGILFQIVVAVLGYSALDWYPLISVLCMTYVIISTISCGALAVACAQKGGIAA